MPEKEYDAITRLASYICQVLLRLFHYIGNIDLKKTELDLRETVQSITGSLQYKTNEKKIDLKTVIDYV